MGASYNNGKSTTEVQTPPEFLAACYRRFKISTFTWDLAATDANTVAPFHFTPDQDALSQDWDECGGWLWLNPPYANITPWVAKASACRESNIAMLVPASVGANWWRQHVDGKAHVLLLNGRIKFVGHKDGFPKDLALLLFTPFIKGGYEVWDWKR